MAIAFDDLRPLHDSGAMYALLSQSLLMDGLTERLGGEFDWSADLDTDSAVFTGRSTGDTITTAVELMATVAPGPASMLWGRAQSRGRSGAQRILERGHADGLPSLLHDEVPFPDHLDPDDACEPIAQEISAVVAAVTDGGLTSVVPIGGAGTRAVILLGALDFARPRIDHRFPTRVSMSLSAVTIEDHRNAVHGLAVMSGWLIAWAEDWGRAELTDPVTGNSSTIMFDDYGRLATLQGSLT